MYALINCTNYTALAVSADYRALSNLAYIQYANVDTMIFPTNESKHWAAFTQAQLELIFNSVIDTTKVPFKSGSSSLSDSIGKVRTLVEAAPQLWLRPRTGMLLEEQAQCIEPSDDRPYEISENGTKPILTKEWCIAPQRNRPRTDHPRAAQVRSVPARGADNAANMDAAPEERVVVPRPKKVEKPLDSVAQELKDCTTLDQLLAVAIKYKYPDVAAMRLKISHLNPGLQRMNVGNRLRSFMATVGERTTPAPAAPVSGKEKKRATTGRSKR